MKLVGIDTGITGAMAFGPDPWMLVNMPIVGAGKGKKELNGPEALRLFREQKPDYAIVEYASARPGQGTVSMFRYGQSYGAVLMALSACEIPYDLVVPTVWKKKLGIAAGSDKEADRQRALLKTKKQLEEQKQRKQPYLLRQWRDSTVDASHKYWPAHAAKISTPC